MARKRSRKGNSRSKRGRSSSSRRRNTLHRLQRWLLGTTLLALGLAALVAWAGGAQGRAASWLDAWLNRPRPVAAAAQRQVGIIAGHKDFDSGATCEDGLTEAETVAEIARQLGERLSRAGARVNLLAEYDPRLEGYQGEVLVSIHADTCLERSGFKVARAADSAIPRQEDALVACLRAHYGEISGIPYDPYTITEDMTGYHAFRRVSPQTAAAIIEVGYLGGDRELLTKRPDLVARAIAEGVLCYLDGESLDNG